MIATNIVPDAAAAVNHRLAAALQYHELGWAPIPLRPRDKRPLGPWKLYQERRLTPEQLHAAWRACPGANVGLVLGPVSGLAALDVDGTAGELLLRLKLDGRQLPFTPEFLTGGGGRRLLFALRPGTAPRTWRLQPDDGTGELRLQSTGAQTVMPPSVHPNGRPYAWISMCHPDEGCLPAALPEYLDEADG